MRKVADPKPDKSSTKRAMNVLPFAQKMRMAEDIINRYRGTLRVLAR
jgi:hypothetical protein